MAENSKIEWCDHTFNPWTGCAAISPGCFHCYAESWANRAGRSFNIPTRTSAANWKEPLKWNRRAEGAAQRPRVFCASLADVFDNRVNPRWRDDLWTLIGTCQNLDWLIVTKRIGNASEMLPWMPGYTGPDGQRTRNPWRNIWLGATVVNQAEADRDIPKLLGIPAAVRFLSMEPLLGPVDLTRLKGVDATGLLPQRTDALRGTTNIDDPVFGAMGITPAELDWIIVGGESGSRARPMHPEWARSLRDQCQTARVPFFFKQWGGTNKKAAGRLLDGRTWDEYPEVRP